MRYGDRFKSLVYARGNNKLWWHTFRFRVDPINWGSGTGKSYVGTCVRHPRTTQERRVYYTHARIVNIRAKRGLKNLPTSWDDINHGRRGRGWKRSKKKYQWSLQ